MHQLIAWSDGTGKAFALLAFVGAAIRDQALAISAAAVAVLVTVVPHAIRAYQAIRAAKRTEDTADLDRKEFESALRERWRMEERVKYLEERIRELEAETQHDRG